MWGWLRGKPKHEHEWKIVAVDHLQGTRWNDHVWKNMPFTRVLYRCEVCGRVMTDEIDSCWTKEQLTGQANSDG